MKEINYPSHVLASAGTGKTHLIASEVVKLVKNKSVNLEDIVIITYTNKACFEMKTRIINLLVENDLKHEIYKVDACKISTIHSFCDGLIREYGLNIDISPSFMVQSVNAEVKRLIEKEMSNKYDKEILKIIPSYKLVALIKKLYDDIDNKGINFSLDEDNNPNLEGKTISLIAKVFETVNNDIEEYKTQKNILTNNDLIKYAIKLLEDKKVYQKVANRYKYMFVDESQDINMMQYDLLKLLSKDINTLIVGDEKQSVYAFRGTNLDAFKLLCKELKENKIELNINYRSDENLIKEINKIFNKKFIFNKTQLNFDNLPLKPNIFDNSKVKPIEAYYNTSVLDAVNNLAHELGVLKETIYNEVVILTRTNQQASYVAQQLYTQNIPAVLLSRSGFYKSKVVRDFIALLNCIIFKKPLHKEEMFFTDYYLAYHNLSKEKDLYNNLEKFASNIRQHSFMNAVNEFLIEAKIEVFYKETNQLQSLANLKKLKEEMKRLENEGNNILEILSYLKVMKNTNFEEPEADVQEQKELNAVTVSTIHNFKGSSKKYVILYEADKSLYNYKEPMFIYDNNKLHLNLTKLNRNLTNAKTFTEKLRQLKIKELEEELRVLYVAITRAKTKFIYTTKLSKDKIKYKASQNKSYISYVHFIEKNI